MLFTNASMLRNEEDPDPTSPVPYHTNGIVPVPYVAGSFYQPRWAGSGQGLRGTGRHEWGLLRLGGGLAGGPPPPTGAERTGVALGRGWSGNVGSIPERWTPEVFHYG